MRTPTPTDASCALPELASCRRCPRLSAHLADIRTRYPDYHAAPVASFGDPAARLLVVGLAPGLQGANRTGRPFTGDHAGLLLFQTLFDYGFSNQPTGLDPADGLLLKDCRITNAVRCLPPGNKPLPQEVRMCQGYLQQELQGPSRATVVLALGRIAHQALLQAWSLRPGDYPFSHGACHALSGGGWLLASYHCSRYNTQTRRLTPAMFQAVVGRARQLLDQPVLASSAQTVLPVQPEGCVSGSPRMDQ